MIHFSNMQLDKTLIGSIVVALGLVLGCNSPEPESPIRQVGLISADSTQLLFDNVVEIARLENWHTLPIGLIVQQTGLQFIGRPYEAGLLDESESEDLLLDLQRFDCVLFVENALAIARGIAKEDYSYESYGQSVEELRYRGGIREGYCSRLHYFTDWIDDNVEKGIVQNITRQLGGDTLAVNRTFMGEHRSSYARLAQNDSLFQGILQMEQNISDQVLYYIPQSGIRDAYPLLNSGDVIATSTSVAGLDVSHTGFAHDNGDSTFGFLHASTAQGVTVAPDLHDYVNSVSIQTGIVVARPISN